MATLDRSLRRELEKVVAEARRMAEDGARKAVSHLGVADSDAPPTLTDEQRTLRRRLRAHGRQLGDRILHGEQSCDRLVAECAYEHWHRLLFARFLAENDLLIESASGMPLSIDEVRELARERDADWIELASGFAQSMLPQIFRPDDPVLALVLPPESRQALERALEALPRDVFLAADSLGWVYQYWQAETKKEVNESGRKIGADELPAVTQLFTEDYMVLFLLENTLGAWWAGRQLAANPSLAESAENEDVLRAATSPAGYSWSYLRFARDEGGTWRPAAGEFGHWPTRAAELRVLDPCMGSGHFLVFALPILAAFRRAEEGVSVRDVVVAVLDDNLFGLELDARCTQLAAFNLALTAWRMGGYQALPALSLACSGLGVNAKLEDWQALAGGDTRLRAGMARLHALFENGPTLGSLITPGALGGDLVEASFRDLEPLLARALADETRDETAHELAVAAQGIASAAEILAGRFTLVATNVPYLGRGRQDDKLKSYCERAHPAAKADLATCFVERCLAFCEGGGTAALVIPQNALLLSTYKKLRKRLLENDQWHLIGRLGEHGFESSQAAGAFIALVALSARRAAMDDTFAGLDASEPARPAEKLEVLLRGSVAVVEQRAQIENPDCAITFEDLGSTLRLSDLAGCWQGVVSGDDNKFVVAFWEVGAQSRVWEWLQMPPQRAATYTGRTHLIRWEGGSGDLHLRSTAHNFPSARMLGRPGIALQRMRDLNATIFSGEIFGDHVAPIVPEDPSLLVPLWCFCTSEEYRDEVRRYDASLKASVGSFLKVPFDLARWQKVAAERFPGGLPAPYSADPTQWLFGGHPKGSEHPLQVGVARLVGYRWPRQMGSSFRDCPALGPDGLEGLADDDGIVCLVPLRGEPPAAERLRTLLAAAFGEEWSPDRLNGFLSRVGFAGKSLDEWLRDGFFAEHCALFHQRPFVWHIWDGLSDGFSVLVNYHRLAGQGGEGKRTLEKLLYSYLGDWIERQRDEQKREVPGAEARVAAAEHLKRELERILAAEPPYDLFVRWKPLHAQPIGWEPDLDDGVRMNIRPFMTARPLGARARNASILRMTPNIRWDKDRGSEPSRPREEFPWFWSWDERTQDFAGGPTFDGKKWNDLHYSTDAKRAARARRSS